MVFMHLSSGLVEYLVCDILTACSFGVYNWAGTEVRLNTSGLLTVRSVTVGHKQSHTVILITWTINTSVLSGEAIQRDVHISKLYAETDYATTASDSVTVLVSIHMIISVSEMSKTHTFCSDSQDLWVPQHLVRDKLPLTRDSEYMSTVQPKLFEWILLIRPITPCFCNCICNLQLILPSK